MPKSHKFYVYSEKDIIRLNYGGTVFRTSKSAILSKAPNSKLADIIQNPPEKDENVVILIDGDPDYFRVIVNYFRYDELILDANINKRGKDHGGASFFL